MHLSPKSLELGADGHLHRGDSFRQLEVELKTAAKPAQDTQFSYAYLPGGGIASTGRVSFATEGDVLTALSGDLTNYPYLVKKYCGDDDDCQSIAMRGLNALNECRPISPATLLCRLYSRLGAGMLAKLRGTFALVCYDSNLVRVMAARDPSGSVDLVHGRCSSSGSLVVASGLDLPDVWEFETIKPGHYKYGWYSDQVKYANDSEAVSREVSEAASAVARALAGIRKPSAPAKNPIRHHAAPARARSVQNGPSPVSDKQLPPSSACAQPFVPAVQPFVPSAVARARAAKRTASNKSKQHAAAVIVPASAKPQVPATPLKKERVRSPSPDNLGDVPRHVLEALSGSLNKASQQYKLVSSMLDSSPCALVITDARKEDHPIVYANRIFELETGYSQEEVLGRNCRFLQAPPSETRVPTFASMALKSGVRDGQARHIRLMNYRKDGSPMWNKLSIVPLRDGAGQVTHFIGMQKFSELGLDEVPGNAQVSWGPQISENNNKNKPDGPTARASGSQNNQSNKSLNGRSTSCSNLVAMAGHASRSNSYGDLQALAC